MEVVLRTGEATFALRDSAIYKICSSSSTSKHNIFISRFPFPFLKRPIRGLHASANYY